MKLAIYRLRHAGLVEIHTREQASNRPTRTGYQILDWLCILRTDLDTGTLQWDQDWIKLAVEVRPLICENAQISALPPGVP